MYDSYVDRKVLIMKENNDELLKLNKEKAEIERELSINGLSMSVKEYKAADDRLNQVIDQIHICENRKDALNKKSIANVDEVEAFASDSREAYKYLYIKAESEIYEYLKGLVPIVEKYNTDMVKLNTLIYAFGSVTDCGVGTYTAILPDLLVLMNRVLLSAYNEYDSRVNDGKGRTTCRNDVELRAGRIAVQETGRKIGFLGIGTVDITRLADH